MDTLLLAFANQSDAPLPTLQEEDDTLHRLLAPRAKERHFLLHRDSYVGLDKLTSAISLYRDELVLFLFSGHAGRDRLLTTDGAAHGQGLAQMLAQCPRLKLVFLNGCSTQGQVAQLLAAGVPAVLATSAPVNDRAAAFFSIRFFEALQQQFSLRAAFDMAKAALNTAFPGIQPEQHRAAGFSGGQEDAGTWGLFCAEKNEHVLDWKLPIQPIAETVSANFTPNQYLIDTLFVALAAYSQDVQKLEQQAKRGVQVGVPKKRMAVLNALPAPLAEPLRKLLVPVEQENEGYDKVSNARLRQISQAFSTAMELLGFTMLAQLWEAYDNQPGLQITDEQRDVLRAFFRLNKSDREVYDFGEMIRALLRVFDQNNIRYFIEELKELRALTHSDSDFAEALQFLGGLRLQVRQQDVEPAAIGYLSQRGEEYLAYLYSRLGFLARYKLATIQGIDVMKYRHQREARYNHATVMLHDLLGGFDISEIQLEKSMDNRSILLINEETWEYLNLSPFVFDENAFQDKTDICKLYFYSHYLKAADLCCYKYVNKPDDPYLEVSGNHYGLIKEQLDAFTALTLQQPLRAL